MTNFWLFKSEPSTFSVHDLEKKFPKSEFWDGVRNYQARNFMREMKIGDLGFFYHSNVEEPGIVGICTVTEEAKPDPTQFDPKSQYYDPKATREKPIWFAVTVGHVQIFKKQISLHTLKMHSENLEGLPLIRKGNRLSIVPVTKKHWDFISKLSKGDS